MSAEIALKLELSDDEDDEDEFDEILHRNSSVKSSQVKVKKGQSKCERPIKRVGKEAGHRDHSHLKTYLLIICTHIL